MAGQEAVEELIVEVAKSSAKELGSTGPVMAASVEVGEANWPSMVASAGYCSL